jgi:hypothetical protein
LTPVWSSKGLTVFSMSACGCGPLGMIQKLTVVPFFRALALAAGVLAGLALSSLLLPPQAETTMASKNATSHEAVASFLRILLSSCAKTILPMIAPLMRPDAVFHPLVRPRKGVTWLTREPRARLAG